MYNENSSIPLDEDSSDDNEMEQDETDIDLEFQPEASSNDIVSENFHIFVQIAFICANCIYLANSTFGQY